MNELKLIFCKNCLEPAGYTLTDNSKMSGTLVAPNKCNNCGAQLILPTLSFNTSGAGDYNKAN